MPPVAILGIALGCAHKVPPPAHPGLVAAEVDVSAVRTDYTIRASDRQGVVDAMAKRGPVRSGVRYAAYTRYYVSYKLDMQHDGELCTANPTVDLKVRYRMPEVARPERLAPADQAWWDAFEQDLWEHEQTHAQHGAQAAVLLAADLQRLRPDPNCGAVQAYAERLFEQRLGEARALDRNLDAASR